VSGSVPEGHVLAGDSVWDPAPPPTPHAGIRRRGWWPLLGLLILAGIAAGLIWQSRTGPQTGAGSYLASPGVLNTVAPDQRLPGPRLRGRLLDGTSFDSAAWAGNIVVINIWGSWCPPCRAETPELVQVANATHSQGVRFLGIDVRDNRAAAQAFTRAYHVPYPSIFDADNQTLLAFRGLPPNAVPTTFVIDRNGRIAARALGRITAAKLTAVLLTLQQEQPPATDSPERQTSLPIPG
jgi:thiol-disulfide isomerase/thioredoxin